MELFGCRKPEISKTVTTSRFSGVPSFLCMEKGKCVSNETIRTDVLLLKNVLTEKVNFAVKENYGVEHQRIGEKSSPP